jgi:hypothetical protein
MSPRFRERRADLYRANASSKNSRDGIFQRSTSAPRRRPQASRRTGVVAGAAGLLQTETIDRSHGHAGRLAIKLEQVLKNPLRGLFQRLPTGLPADHRRQCEN